MSETTNSETYDIIFAGGGAVACITAGRLAQADPSLKILVIESGPHTQELQEHVQPGRYFSNLTLPGKTFTFHVAQPSDSLAGRSVIVPSGRCLGGGSSVNFTVYTRAAASDYDDWETVFGNKGWGSKELIPLLKKAETYQSEIFNSTHGTSGPIKASIAASEVNVAEQFLEVAVQYDKERTLAEDINDFTTTNKYGRWARYIDAESGRRSDAPHHYIYNQRLDGNLRILDRKRVVRVIFEGNKAVGVEYVDDIVGDGTGRTRTSVVHASRLVVVSAGAFGSPAILERSGIGARSILEKNGIQVLVDLSGVGENYMDHNLIFAPYFATEDSDTMDALFRGSEEEVEPYVTQWKNEGKGLMAHNALDAGIKLRPTASELEELGPEFEERWKSYFANAPDKPVMLFAPFTAYVGLNPNTPRGKYFSMCYFTGYPVASGHVHITSGLDAYGRLNFKPGYLEDMADVVVLRWAYKKGREIARRMNAYRGELDLGHPEFPTESEAVPKPADGPVDMNTTKIKYTPEDDKAIDEYHRKTVETTWHSVGTCAMKPRESGGVVDERLNVYGVRNLKVADCSITPGNVGANTYNTAIAIGEKSAVIIAEDLGIKGVTTA
ncbi:GMC oxidoreductase-domain-containing protein [Cyathus striatus]|nr:GMC oxidoreductase-domain-containing protein [Cyathus striatus]